jgi:hypothetical protein
LVSRLRRDWDTVKEKGKGKRAGGGGGLDDTMSRNLHLQREGPHLMGRT